MGLMETYEAMQKEAEVAEVEAQRRDVLTKYASAAEELLENEYGDDYNAEDVELLAEALIEADVQAAEQQEKVAEYENAGKLMAQAFVEELKASKEAE